MRVRRKELEDLLEEDEICVSISAFPLLGTPDFTSPPTLPDPQNSFTRSLFWPSEATFLGHPRFARSGLFLLMGLMCSKDVWQPNFFVMRNQI